MLDRDGAPVVDERPRRSRCRSRTLPPVRPDRPLEAELRALITVSSAVAGAHRFEDVLDAVGEQACKVLRAAGISISRWEPEHDRMRTLINAGELTPGDVERPASETWAPSALDRALVERGRPYVVALDQPELPDEERAYLERIGRGSVLAAPIRFDDSVWGVLEAFSDVGRAAVHRVARALRGGAVRPGGDRDRPRRAVLAPGVARLPGPAHARCRTGARSTSASRRPSRAAWPRVASCRCCSATSTA